MLHGSLWGNRTDLSYTIAAHLGATATPGAERDNLLVDDWAEVGRTSPPGKHQGRDRHGQRRDRTADGRRARRLPARAELASEVHLHLKPQPFYVSDAMIKDLADGTDALIEAGGQAARLGRRVDAAVAAGEIIPQTHPFYCSPLFYKEMPADLRADAGGVEPRRGQR